MDHLGGWQPGGDEHTHMPDVWGYLIIRYNIRSVLDVGCGLGLAVEWFDHMGCDVHGIEGDQLAIDQSSVPHMITPWDYTQGDLLTHRSWHMGMAMEFVEHVDHQYQHHYMATLSECDRVLISHAPPGQPGHHHVNCQPKQYWVDLFDQWGFDLDHAVTDLLVASNQRRQSPWSRPNLLWFQHRRLDH